MASVKLNNHWASRTDECIAMYFMKHLWGVNYDKGIDAWQDTL